MANIFVIIVLLLVVFIITVVIAKFGLIWVRAFSAGVSINWFTLIGISIRRVSPSIIVDCRVIAVKAGLAISYEEIETHVLSGGRVINVVQALVMANKAKIPLDWQHACAIDLAGRDVLDAVRTSTHPKVIDVPASKNPDDFISAIAKDGIQLKVKARVTVRTNLRQLIGGAVEETIVARVGEGIVTSIGSAHNHKDVLENPDRISKTVLAKGLDSGTAFEILSIDIADIDVGQNIGAQLQSDQAEANKKVAQAKAEERRAMAVALAQEMSAKVEENRAQVVLAEAEVPRAISEAFRSGRLGVMDYYQMRNLQADTEMRRTLAQESGEK